MSGINLNWKSKIERAPEVFCNFTFYKFDQKNLYLFNWESSIWEIHKFQFLDLNVVVISVLRDRIILAIILFFR